MKCQMCSESFTVSDARDEYNSYFRNELDYDLQYPAHELCGRCAIGDSESLMEAGRDAITGGQDVEITWLD